MKLPADEKAIAFSSSASLLTPSRLGTYCSVRPPPFNQQLLGNHKEINYVWLKYTCTPQSDRKILDGRFHDAALQSQLFYARCCAHFVALVQQSGPRRCPILLLDSISLVSDLVAAD